MFDLIIRLTTVATLVAATALPAGAFPIEHRISVLTFTSLAHPFTAQALEEPLSSAGQFAPLLERSRRLQAKIFRRVPNVFTPVRISDEEKTYPKSVILTTLVAVFWSAVTSVVVVHRAFGGWAILPPGFMSVGALLDAGFLLSAYLGPQRYDLIHEFRYRARVRRAWNISENRDGKIVSANTEMLIRLPKWVQRFYAIGETSPWQLTSRGRFLAYLFAHPFRMNALIIGSPDRIAMEKTMTEKDLVSYTDALTGIPNRLAFKEFAQWFDETKEDVGSVTILAIDGDRFKSVNDTYGHAAGDQVLKYIAHTVRAQVQRKSDFVARIGGEEFVVILRNASLDRATAIAEKIRAAVQANSSKQVCPVTISIGLAEFQTSDATLEETYNRADQMLYQAKENGRNRVEVATRPSFSTRLTSKVRKPVAARLFSQAA